MFSRLGKLNSEPIYVKSWTNFFFFFSNLIFSMTESFIICGKGIWFDKSINGFRRPD